MKRLFSFANDFLHKLLIYFKKNKVAVNVNNSNYKKNCLIIYVVAPFISTRFNASHQNLSQVVEMAKVIDRFGYNVDVVNYDNRNAQLTKYYDLLIDLHPGLNSFHNSYLAAGCVKIAYITGSNPDFSNSAESKRLADLESRRGRLLTQRRFAKPFNKDELESFDAMFFVGNQHNLMTYDDFNIKRLYFIKNNGVSFPQGISSQLRSPRKFLFLGGYGQVHKGLDLLLEVFNRNRDLELYICSSLKSELDFCMLYDNELFNSENIFSLGFIDVLSAEFIEIASICSYVVLPSCSEGISGSVLTGMSAGLVPIVSRECGFDQDEVHLFPDCSLESVEVTLREFSEKSPEWLLQESEKAKYIASTRYNAEEYRLSVQSALKELFDDLCV